MLINRTGESFTCEEGTFTIGEKIYANSNSDWEGLFGIITEIRTDADKETENETPDIYCSFGVPDILEDIRELEQRFSELYGEPKAIEDIPLDLVIMAPEMLDRLAPWEKMGKEDVYLPVLCRTGRCRQDKPVIYTSMRDAKRKISEETGYICTGATVKCCSMVVDPVFQRKMYETYREERIMEDMAGQMEQDPDFTGLSRETVRKIFAEPHLADRFDDILRKNNTYWESYWNCVDSLIRELVEKISSEGEGETA